MKKIICLLGESGSGKSTILNLLLSTSLNKLPIKRLVYSTTRKKRENEVEGIDYHFTTSDDFDTDYPNNILEYRSYLTINNGYVYYYTKIDDLRLHDGNILLGTASAEQISKYIDARDRLGLDVYVIKITTSTKERLLRLINRCNSDIEVEEAIRRVHEEKEEFKIYKDNIINNSKKYIEIENNYDYKVDKFISFIKEVVNED